MEESIGSAPVELGQLGIGKLLKSYAVPAIIAQLAASLYNMVDSIFIGHIPDAGANAISGLAVTFPMMNLSIALGTLVGVGAMTILSIYLGEHRYSEARSVLSNVLSLNVIVGILFSIVMLIFLDPLLYFFGASDATIPYAREYMQIILYGNVITHLYFGFNGIIRASGHPKTAMYLTLFTVFSNAALDPIFIFTFGLGIKGAAIATVLCQTISLAYTLYFLADKKKLIHFPRPLFQLDWDIAKKSMAIGLSPFLMNASACIVDIFINQQLSRYGGDVAIGAYGIIYRISTVFFLLCIGFNQAMQPIVGYNFGARKYARVKKAFILTTICELVCTTSCFLLSEFLPGASSALFTTDQDLLDTSVHAMRICNCAFAVIGFGAATSIFFQCLGMVGKAVFLSLSRQLIFLIPMIVFLPKFWGLDGIWWSFPISDVISVVFASIMILSLFKKFDKLKEGEEFRIGGILSNNAD